MLTVFFPTNNQKYIYWILSDELSANAISKPKCWHHSHVTTDMLVPAIKTAGEKKKKVMEHYEQAGASELVCLVI